jgi:response regulator of citrate/malate metabolism
MSIISDASKIKRIEDLEEKIRFLQEELNEIKKEEGIEVKNKSTVGRKPIILKDKNNELVTNKKIFQMYNDENKSLEEIASHCGCSRNTIRKRLPIKFQKDEEVSKMGDHFSIQQ